MNKLPAEKRAQILHMLCEGNSIRAVERMTGCDQTQHDKFSQGDWEYLIYILYELVGQDTAEGPFYWNQVITFLRDQYLDIFNIYPGQSYLDVTYDDVSYSDGLEEWERHQTTT